MATATATKRKRKTAPKPAEAKPVPCYRIPRRYTAGQLVKLYRMCKTDPDGFTLVVGERADGWDEGQRFTPAAWLEWFRAKLGEKMQRGEVRPGRDRDNEALRRLRSMRAERRFIHRSDLNGIRNPRTRQAVAEWVSE